MGRHLLIAIRVGILYLAILGCGADVAFTPATPQVNVGWGETIQYALKQLPADCNQPYPIRVIYGYRHKTGTYELNSCSSLVLSGGSYIPSGSLGCTGSYTISSQSGKFTVTSPAATCQGSFSSITSGDVNINCSGGDYIKFSGHDEFVYKKNGNLRQLELWGALCKATVAPPPPPPTTEPAFVTAIASSSSGAVATLSGPVQGLRYSYDSSNGFIDLSSPYNSPYTINKVWPTGTTFVCAQAQGTDGVWRGNNTTQTQTCTTVAVPVPTPVPRTLAWDPVTTTISGETITNLAGYIVYYTDVNGDWSKNPSIVVSAPTTSHTFTNLISGKTYFFAVSAFNTANQESAKSTTLVYTQP
jgi:hypothetical protein